MKSRTLMPARTGAVGLLAAGLLAVTLAGGTAASAADPIGCDYGSGGPFADTLCWIDMSLYNDTAARSIAGQPMSIMLPGGYTASFTVRTSDPGAIAPSLFPTWDYGATVGVDIYVGTEGQPALYQTSSNTSPTTISLTDIVVEDSEGSDVHDWRFVGVDAEATALNESITFTSDVPVSVLSTFATAGALNGCQVSVTQVDDNTVSCTGGTNGDDYGTVLVSAIEPGTFTQTMIRNAPAARQAVAFAFQSSKIQLDATVESRVTATDSFTVEVTSPESTVVGSASTGTGSAASTGQLTVLPLVGGSSYTLAALPGSGTSASAYDFDWTCTTNGVADPGLSTSGVTSIDISPDAGNLVACTVAIGKASAARLAATGGDSSSTILGFGAGLFGLGLLAALISVRRRAQQ